MFRQELAYPARGQRTGFASLRALWHPDRAGLVCTDAPLPFRPTTPSQYCRSVPMGRGPGFAQVSAKPFAGQEFPFPNRKLRVYCNDITTNHPRGRTSCVSRPSFWRQQPYLPLQAVCRIPLRAGLRAPRRARFWLMPPTTTRLPARLSAALRVLQPAASTLGCLPATTIDLTAAPGAACPVPSRLAGPIGPRRPFVLRHRACGLRGES